MSDREMKARVRGSRPPVAPVALLSSALLLALVAAAPVVALVFSLWLHPAAAADEKVTVCHRTGNGWNTIEIAPSALDEHLAHGDYPGACTTASPTATPTESPTGTPTTSPTATATPDPTPTPSPTATPTPDPTPTAAPTAPATPDPPPPAAPPATAPAAPTPSPTATPTPDPTPTATAAAGPTLAATSTATSVAPPMPANSPTAAAAIVTPTSTPPTTEASPPPSATSAPRLNQPPSPPSFVLGPGDLFIPTGPSVTFGASPALFATATPTATATPARTASPTPAATRTPIATRTPSPPPAATPAAPSPAAPTTSPPDDDNPARSLFVRGFPAFDELSASPAVILTNALLSLLALMLILLACTVFNSTLEENGSQLASVLGRLVGPFGLSLAWIRGDDNGDGERPISLWRLGLILLAVAAVYSGLDPEFGWNAATAALVISLTVGVGLLTFIYEGAQVLFGARAGARSSLQLQPLGIVIAALSVIITRLTDVHPGIVLGVIAGAAVGSHDTRLQGRIVTAAMLGVLGLSLGSLLAIGPLQSLATGHPGDWWAVIPETVAVTLFVGGIEGLLFSLLPLKFMEGRRVWDWNRAVWLALGVAVSFLFFHVVLNRTDAYTSVVEETGVRALFAVCVGSIVLASGFWLACRQWLPRSGEPETAPA
ncbi:MAG: FGLLP motif-containing membrane protein [Dehalococcoidia bacterium]